MTFDGRTAKVLALPMLAMAGVILLSNIAVQHPVAYTFPLGAHEIDLAQILTWGAFTYPICFLVNDTTNRLFGPKAARRVVYAGFVVGVILSVLFADIRIGIASGAAFLTAQLLDVLVFDRLRRAAWWKAPAVSSLLGSAADTALFFTLAFAGTGLPWMNWAVGDFAVKLLMIAALLYPFKLLVAFYPPALRDARAG